MVITSELLTLKHGLSFEDLYDRDGLVRVDQEYVEYLKTADVELFNRLMAARAGAVLSLKEASELIIALAPHLDDFIGDLFGITTEVCDLRDKHASLAANYIVKRKFIHKKALTGMTPEKAGLLDIGPITTELETLFGEPITDDCFAQNVHSWMQAEADHPSGIAKAAQYAAWATLTPEGKAKHRGTSLFKAPSKIDPYHLVPVETIVEDGVTKMLLGHEHARHREAFHLTDKGMDLLGALDQANYCIHCHNQAKDSCRTGLKEKTGEFKKSVFGVTLAGCPLDERSPRCTSSNCRATPSARWPSWPSTIPCARAPGIASATTA